MKAILKLLPDSVPIQIRAEDEGMVGDARWNLKPGDDALGMTYEQWRAMGDGEHELPRAA